MSPSHAFLILAGITLALAAIGAAIALWATRKAARRRQIAEHTDEHFRSSANPGGMKS